MLAFTCFNSGSELRAKLGAFKSYLFLHLGGTTQKVNEMNLYLNPPVYSTRTCNICCRRMLFEHLRLTEDRDDGTMHVSNPMYMKNMEVDDGDQLEPEDDAFSVYSSTNVSRSSSCAVSVTVIFEEFDHTRSVHGVRG